MKTFGSLAGLAAELGGVAAKLADDRKSVLEEACKIIEDDAKASLGTDLNGWPPLSEATQADRVRKGYSADEPLLRSKALQGAIDHEVLGPDRALIGVAEKGQVEPEGASVADVAGWMEYGAANAPPRPFMGPAGVRKGQEAADAVGRAIAQRLKGR